MPFMDAADAGWGGTPTASASSFVGSFEETGMWSNVALGASPVRLQKAPPLATARGRSGKPKK
jgi:hypothetical protein